MSLRVGGRVPALVLTMVAVMGGAAGCTMQAEHSPSTGSPELQQAITSLEQRKARLEDVNDIKRLQRAYGFYFSSAQWDEVTSLFADNGSIEIGLDGVYRGKPRVREYLYAFGGGKAGLAPGQLNEYLQVMPVITLSADGQSAKGTWRAIVLAGQLGKDALWGEGPYENEYVKENGVWKISSVHWYQTLLVPFAGGWIKQGDVNGTRFVGPGLKGDGLKPDAPPSVSYKSWPNAFVPPFHFKDQPQAVQPPPAPAEPVAPLATQMKRVAQLTADVHRIDDQLQIEILQQTYGYYLDKGLWSQAADLFADNGEIEVEGRGAHVGKEHVLGYLRAIGPEGPVAGRLYDHMQLAPVVHVSPDGKTAKARWALFAQLARQKDFAEWGTGVYENEYVNDGGVWKIRKLHLYPTMYTPYEAGWAKTIQPFSSFEPDLKADRASGRKVAGPAPYHFANPVTGRAVRSSSRAGAEKTPASASDALTALSDLRQKVGLLEDEQQIENVHAMYGYYLATLEWDRLTNLFAEDGTIEIALRGVYVGKAAVRRNLNLYGQQGLDNGVLHNHMQFQPVIHVAADGKTAKMRSRAFSMMGNFNQNGMWMGGVYENDFVKVNGEWKFKKDQVMNTYFAPYDIGWKTLAPRDAPGITASNPPDRPPSFHFDMFPKSFLPPFHYANPVTGKPTTWP